MEPANRWSRLVDSLVINNNPLKQSILDSAGSEGVYPLIQKAFQEGDIERLHNGAIELLANDFEFYHNIFMKAIASGINHTDQVAGLQFQYQLIWITNAGKKDGEIYQNLINRIGKKATNLIPKLPRSQQLGAPIELMSTIGTAFRV